MARTLQRSHQKSRLLVACDRVGLRAASAALVNKSSQQKSRLLLGPRKARRRSHSSPGQGRAASNAATKSHAFWWRATGSGSARPVPRQAAGFTRLPDKSKVARFIFDPGGPCVSSKKL